MADSVTKTTVPPSRPGSGDPVGPRAAQAGYKALPEEMELIQLITARLDYSQRPMSHWGWSRQMFENLAFICGVQWTQYNSSTKTVSAWNAPTWFPTPVDNQIAPRVAGMQARLLQSRPTGRVRPNQNDAKHREGARVAEIIGTHIDDVTDEDEKRDLAALIAVATGTVIMYDYYNPNAGPTMVIPRQELQSAPQMRDTAECPACGVQEEAPLVGTPCPTCTGQAQHAMATGGPEAPPAPPLVAGQKPVLLPDGTAAESNALVDVADPATGQPMVDVVRQGEIESDVKMAFNFLWDPKATTLRKARWCGELAYVDLEWIDENFPDMGPFVAAEEGVDQVNFYEASLAAMVGPSMQGTAHQGGSQSFQGGAVLRIYQQKPSAKYPDGVWGIVANGVLLYPVREPAVGGGGAPSLDDFGEPQQTIKPSLPIKDLNGKVTGDFSYEEFPYDIVPGRLLGRTPVDDMLSLQRRINGILAQIILNRKTLLNPWVLAPKGSGLSPGQVAMRPACTVVYNYVGIGVQPQVVPGTPLPDSIYTELEGCMASMDRLAQDPRGSAAPTDAPGMKSGVLFNLAREERDAEMTPRLARWARFMARRKRKQLLLAQAHYREPRMVKVTGPGDDYLVRSWQGSDLAGNTDFTIDPGSILPRSQALHTQKIFDALELKLIDPTNTQQRQQLIEELDLLEFETDIGPDKRRAQKENAEMDEGTLVLINERDNHEVHLQTHLPRVKDPSYDYLAPESQAAYEQHIAAHMMQVIQQQQKMQAAAQMDQANGTPPGGGGGGVDAGPPDPANEEVAPQAA